MPQTEGFLIEGRKYVVIRFMTGDDFSNIGGPNDLDQSNLTFVSSGTSPLDWSNGSEIMDYKLSAPKATVLKNGSGNISWYYHGKGQYHGVLQGAFPPNKTMVSPIGFTYLSQGSEDVESVNVLRASEDIIIVQTFKDGEFSDNILSYFPIEIKVSKNIICQ